MLVTRDGRRAPRAATSTFQHIGEVKLKGFDEATELFLARAAGGVSAAIEARVRAGGLLAGPRRSCCSPAGATRSACSTSRSGSPAGRVAALHVDYGLRAESDADEAHCAALCARLGVALHVAPRRRAGGATCQAWARDVRYAAGGAARARARRRDRRRPHRDRPGRDRALPARRLARPPRAARDAARARAGSCARCSAVTREQTAAYCARARAGLARGRHPTPRPPTRATASAHGLPARCATLHPAAEANVLRTLALLRDEAAVLDAAVDAALRELGDAPEQAALAALPAGARAARAAARSPTRRSRGRRRSAPRLDELLALGGGRRQRPLDLGGGLRAVAEYGRLRFEPAARARAPGPAALPVPGRAALRRRRAHLRARARPAARRRDARRGRARDAALEVRAWRPGDRMRPLGPRRHAARCRTCSPTARSRARARARWPVVTSAGEIAWIPRRRHRRALRGRTGDPRSRPPVLARTLGFRAHAARRVHRRDPRPARRAAAPDPRARRGDLARLRRARTCC